MLNRHLAGRFAALVIVLSIPAFARAQTLANRVPGDSVIYVGWAGVNSDVPGYQGSKFQAMLADSNIPAVVDDFIPKVLEGSHEEEDKDTAKAVGGPRGGWPDVAASFRRQWFEASSVDPNKGPRPKLVLLCQAGNESAALKAKVDDLLKQAGQPPFPVNVIQRGDLLALVIGYDKPDEAIVEAGGKSLAADPNFAASLAQVNKDGFLTVYVDAEKLFGIVDMGTAMAGDEVKKNWEKANDLLGLKGVKRAIFSGGFDGKDWGAKAFIAAPAPRTGLIGAMIDTKPFVRRNRHRCHSHQCDNRRSRSFQYRGPRRGPANRRCGDRSKQRQGIRPGPR